MSAVPFQLQQTTPVLDSQTEWEVPSDFMGICWLRYPVEGVNPVGVINWKSHRLSQNYSSQWLKIETSAGSYSATVLAELDSIITNDRQQGATVIMGAYGTPRFYADNTTPNPTYTDYITKGPWEAYGECAHPTNLTALANYCTMLVNRYNKPGGAWYDQHGATLGKGIQYWEPWNEPPVDPTGSNTNSDGDGTKSWNFYWGSKGQLVDLCKTQYDAVKTADSSIIFMSPGLGPPSQVLAYLGASGAVNTGTTGADICEMVAWHPYGLVPIYNGFGAWEGDIVDGSSGIRTMRNALAHVGYDLPLLISEWGFSTGSSDTMDAWDAASAEFRYTLTKRTLVVMAAYGVKAVHPWHFLSDCCFGDLRNDTDGVQKAYNEVADQIAGRTISGIEHYRNGQIKVIVDGQALTI